MSAFAEFEKNQDRLYRRGRLMVWIIALIEIALAVTDAILAERWLSCIIPIAIACLLIAGFPWARWFYAILNAINVLATLFLWMGGTVEFERMTPLAWAMIIISLFYFFYLLLSSILLFTNQAIKEYMYVKRNG